MRYLIIIAVTLSRSRKLYVREARWSNASDPLIQAIVNLLLLTRGDIAVAAYQGNTAQCPVSSSSYDNGSVQISLTSLFLI